MQLQLRIQLSWNVGFGTFFGSAISVTTLNVQGSVSVTAHVTATANVTATVTVTATGSTKSARFSYTKLPETRISETLSKHRPGASARAMTNTFKRTTFWPTRVNRIFRRTVAGSSATQ